MKTKTGTFIFILFAYLAGSFCEVKATDEASSLLNTYYSNEEIEGYLRNFTETGPCKEISRMFSLGKSVNNVDLWVLEIAQNPGVVDEKPNFKYVANMHGDETSGRQLLLKLADWLCEQRYSNEKAKSIVQGMHLFLMPTMNPDGYTLRSRENKNGIDLNRDFPDRLEDKSRVLKPTGKEQPETSALMKWIQNGFFVGSGNLHEGAIVANYPWDNKRFGQSGYSSCPDDETFVYLATVYATSHRKMSESEEFPGGITNGNAWYPIYGSMQDYNYIMGNCMELTLELSELKHPHVSELPSLWEDNKEAFLDFAIAAAFRGFRGKVTGDGAPLGAKIDVKDIKKDYFTRPEIGDFYRPLAPGKYEITVSSLGYSNVTKKVEIVKDKATPTFNIEMWNLNSINLRSVNVQIFESERAASSWTPNLVVIVMVTVFLVLGIYQVRKLSKLGVHKDRL